MKYLLIIAFVLELVFYSMILVGKQADQRYKRIMKGRGQKINVNEGNKLSLVIENGREDTFTDYTAIYGYPNYLFRTDSRQKWTNEETHKNFCIWAGELDVHQFTDDYPHRQELNIELRRRFVELADGKNITKRRFYRRVRFFDLWFIDSDMELVNVELSESIQALVVAILNKLIAYDKIVPICAVAHADEGVSHIHFLYYIKPQYKKVPHIKEILNDTYIE